jgi:hypothetical protein
MEECSEEEAYPGEEHPTEAHLKEENPIEEGLGEIHPREPLVPPPSRDRHQDSR